MVQQATTPTLDELKATCPYLSIKAHGTAVGLPSDDDMGNSEVGHNALGCGQVYSQGAKLVNESIESGKIYASQAWKELIGGVKANGATPVSYTHLDRGKKRVRLERPSGIVELPHN